MRRAPSLMTLFESLLFLFFPFLVDLLLACSLLPLSLVLFDDDEDEELEEEFPSLPGLPLLLLLTFVPESADSEEEDSVDGADWLLCSVEAFELAALAFAVFFFEQPLMATANKNVRAITVSLLFILIFLLAMGGSQNSCAARMDSYSKIAGQSILVAAHFFKRC